MMDFALSDDQEELRKVARSFLETRCPAGEVRRLETAARGWSPELWSEMAEMGWVAMALPDGGGDLIDLAVIFEELGRAVCPTPLFSTVAVAGLTLAQAGCLPDEVASGEMVVGSALVDVPPASLSVQADGDDLRVSGTAQIAYDVQGASSVLVAAGDVLALVPSPQPGITSTRLQAMSNDRLNELVLDGAAATVVGPVDELLVPALARATALRCVELVGVMGRALEMAADYTRTRVQFGKPLGSFQAVQHRLADNLLDLEGARLAAYRAVWALISDPLAIREVSVAKAWVSDAGQRVAFGAQQVHGGIGVDMDYDLQLYFRRAKALELEFGSAPRHREVVAATLGLR